MKTDKLLKIHSFAIDSKNTGGESLLLTTKFYANGDKITDQEGVYVNQEITLNSYGNSASFNLCATIFTPERLRELANQLEQEKNKLIEK